MRFFHTIVCTGTRNFHFFVSHGARHETITAALDEARTEIKRQESACGSRHYFIRLFCVDDGVGVELDPVAPTIVIN